MILRDLISELRKPDPNTIIKIGFHNPHSYRGRYECLAFELTKDISIGEMLKDANEALGVTYVGYKGGMFTTDEYTRVYLAFWGECGEELGERLLAYMLADVVAQKS